MQPHNRDADLPYEPLTDRELVVLRLVADGLSNGEIAEQLSLSLHTVKTFLKRIFGKLRAGRRTQAVMIGRALGLLGAAPLAPGRIPAPPTPFIGREVEMAHLLRLLSDPAARLVTIQGPGGAGKTRLAIAASNTLEERSPGRVCYVPLEGIGSGAEIAPAIAHAIGFQLQGRLDPADQLLLGLRDRDLLLVLDNFEHMLDSAGFIGGLLDSLPDLRIMVTSRERLNLRGESILPLHGLEYPASPDSIEDYSAVRLFLQTARRLEPSFDPTPDDLAHIAAICRLVEGLPLCIELAAAWVPVLLPAHIAAEIERGLAILETRLRDVPDRHRSIHAVFEHSWRLLSDAERSVFKQLAVFREGFGRDAAEAVAGASLFLISTLVDKSLVVRAGPQRFRLHELLRKLAEEKLAEDPADHAAALDRHGAHYAALLGELEVATRRDPSAWVGGLITIQVDSDNIQAAWERAADQALIDDLLKMAFMLPAFYDFRVMPHQAIRAMARAIDSLRAHGTPAPPILWLRLITPCGWHNHALWNLPEARAAYEEALPYVAALDEDAYPHDIGQVLGSLGWVMHTQGESAGARPYLLRGAELGRRAGIGQIEWFCAAILGEIEGDLGDRDAALATHRRALALAESIHDPACIQYSLAFLACRAASDYPLEAINAARRALSMSREVMILTPFFMAILAVGALIGWQGDRPRAVHAIAVVLAHPQCASAPRNKALHLLAAFDASADSAPQPPDPLLEPDFKPGPALIDRLLAALDTIPIGAP